MQAGQAVVVAGGDAVGPAGPGGGDPDQAPLASCLDHRGRAKLKAYEAVARRYDKRGSVALRTGTVASLVIWLPFVIALGGSLVL